MTASDQVTFSRESFQTLHAEAMPLFKKHFKEVSHYQDIELDIDVEKYLSLEQQGMLRVFIARKNFAAIGYALFFVKNNIRYQKSVQAVQDVLFIDPDHRGVGRKLIEYCDEYLRSEGIQVVYHHVKAKPELNFGPLLERMGYELVDLIYAKRLDKWA